MSTAELRPEPLADWTVRVQASPVRRRLAAACLVAAALLGLSLGLRGPGPMQILWPLVIVLGALTLPPLHRMTGFWYGAAGILLVLASCWAAGAPVEKVPPLLAWLLLTVLLSVGTVHAWAARTLFIGVGLGLVGTALLTIAQSVIGGDEPSPLGILPGGPRFGIATGSFPHWTSNGTALAMGFFACMVPRRWSRGWQVARWTLAMLCLIACVLSQSRAALLALAAGGGVWVALLGRARFGLRKQLGLSVLLLALAGSGLLLMHWVNPDRVSNLLAGNDVRQPLWRVTWHLIQEHPWLGLGGAQPWRADFPNAWTTVIGQPPQWLAVHGHHLFLALAAFYGIPATLGYAGWLASLVRNSWRLPGPGGRAGLVILAVYLVGGQFDAFLLHRRVGEVLVLLLAVLWLEDRSAMAAPPCA